MIIRMVRMGVMLGSFFTALYCAEPDLSQAPVPKLLSLSDTVRLSVATIPVDLARLEFDVRSEEAKGERAALLPRVFGSAEIRYRDSTPNFEGDDEGALAAYSARIRAGQALLDLFAWHRSAAARERLAAGQAEVALATKQTARAAALQHVALIAAQDRLAIRESDLLLAENLAQKTRREVKAGTTDPISATRADTEVAAARAAVLRAKGEMDRAAIELVRLLDMPAGTPLRAIEQLHPSLIPEIPQQNDAGQAIGYALDNRSEIDVSTALRAEQSSVVEAEEGAFYPRVEAFAEASYGGFVRKGEDLGWAVGVEMTVPIYHDGRYRLSAARHRQAQQELRHRQLRSTIEAQVLRTLSSIATAAAELQAEDNRRALATKELQQAEARFIAGRSGNLEVVEAQRRRRTAELAHLRALAELNISRINFISSLGAIDQLVPAESAELLKVDE